MSVVRQPRYSKADFAKRGDEIYERDIRSKVELDHQGEFVAIDIDTGEWELSPDALKACDRLISRLPDCQTWLVRVGHPFVHRMGRHNRSLATYPGH